MDIKLVAVTEKDIQWLREQRNRPELYKYFRQDRPISERDQILWWRGLDKARSRLFIVVEGDNKVGYVGFLPFNHYGLSAEFGIFIVPEFQKKGLGRKAMQLLLEKGFREYRLSTIYSDTLMYPGEEKRWKFFESLGFQPYANACQGIRYKKQGKWIPSLKFYMTKDRYEELNGQNRPGGLVAAVGEAVRRISKGQGKS